MKRCKELIDAAEVGNYDLVAQLIEIDFAGDLAVNVNYQEPKNGYSALHYAVIANDKKLANLLVKNYADIKAPDSNGQTPMHHACIKGFLDIFKLLIAACYQANECIDIFKRTPLDYARDYNH